MSESTSSGLTLPVLQVSPQALAPRALVVGDPRRAEDAALLLEQSRQVGANREYRMVLYGAAMAVSFPFIMVGIRFAFKAPSWGWMLAAGTLVALLASAVITLIDYRDMCRSANR